MGLVRGNAITSSIQSAPVDDIAAFSSRWVLNWLADQPAQRHQRLEHAALVFLDISGFTAMSEMLATLGRIGSEEVREVVNRTFGSLLDLAYAEGASLLKFGGDALLLLFEGEDAAGAAVRSAWTMRERLHADNPVTTAAGSLDLDMTVGVHAGPVDLFLVGDSHRELIVAGPAGTAVIETEGAADKGQILLSPGVPDDLPGMAARVRDDGLRELLAAAPGGGNVPAPVDVADLGEDQHVLSPPVERRVAEDRGGEHRKATVAFVHYGGTDQILADEGPDALAEALHELTSIVQSACDGSNVCFLSNDIDADGGKFILTAGVPTAADDDDDRMVHACRRIVEAHPRLHVQVGINRGPVFSGVVGPPYRLTYTVLGDAVNLAARIMSRADHGQVLAEASVLNRCRALYELTPLEPFHVKGKQAAVRAGAIGDELGVRIRIRSDDTGFVGRDAELGRLLEITDEIDRTGIGKAVCLTGPAGIGKSRLIDELQERRPDVPLQLVACSRFGAERPYRAAQMLLRLILTGERHGPPEPVIEAARRFSFDHPDVLPWIPLLADVFDIDIEDTPETAALAPEFRAAQTRRTVSLLLASALWQEAVIVVEDIQWLDPESRELLVEQGRHMLTERPWLVIATTRDPDTIVEGMEELALAPLEPGEARQLALGAVDRGELSMDRATTIVERAAGNPLFLIELIRSASAGDLPDSLESLFQNRIDALPAQQRRLLTNAAVLGLEFPPDLLDALADANDDVDARALEELGEFVQRMRSGYWRFSQSLYQEVAYSSLPFRTRRRLHGRAARALENIQAEGGIIAIEALSRHHHLGGEYDKSWDSSRQAFAVARGRSAVETAARFARRALEAGRRIKAPDRAMSRTWEGLGDMLELSGAYADAEDAYRAARAHANLDAEVRLTRKVGHVKERVGAYTQALRWYTKSERAIAELVGAGSDELAQTRVRRAVTLMRQGRSEFARRIADDLLERELSTVDRAYALWIVGWALSERQDLSSTERLKKAAAMFGAAGEPGMQAVALNAVGADSFYRGDWVEAVEHYQEARNLWERVGDRGNQFVAEANIGEILADQGHYELAKTSLLAAHAFGKAARHEVARLFPMLVLGRLEARVGNHDEASTWLGVAEEHAREVGIAAFVTLARIRRAELAWFQGDEQATEHWLSETLASCGNSPGPDVDTWVHRLRACLQHGIDRQGAQQELELAWDIATRASMPFDQLLARATMTHLGFADHRSWTEARARDLGIVFTTEQLVGPVRTPAP